MVLRAGEHAIHDEGVLIALAVLIDRVGNARDLRESKSALMTAQQPSESTPSPNVFWPPAPPVIDEDHSGLLEEGLPEDPRDALVDERGEVLDRCLESDEGGGLLGRSKGAIGQSSS